MVSDYPNRILEVLRKNFALPDHATLSGDPFTTLIVTIISQNTTDRTTAKAYDHLSKKFRITPEALANASRKEIESSLKVAGLYRNKAKTIKLVARTILERYGGSLQPILSLPTEEAREILMRFPGIGPKTADVVLLFCARKDTIPIDTHVDRVSKRLNLAPSKGNYESVRRALQSIYHPEEYVSVHLLMILLGRRYCRARTPLCRECPLRKLCPSRHLFEAE